MPNQTKATLALIRRRRRYTRSTLHRARWWRQLEATISAKIILQTRTASFRTSTSSRPTTDRSQANLATHLLLPTIAPLLSRTRWCLVVAANTSTTSVVNNLQTVASKLVSQLLKAPTKVKIYLNASQIQNLRATSLRSVSKSTILNSSNSSLPKLIHSRTWWCSRSMPTRANSSSSRRKRVRTPNAAPAMIISPAPGKVKTLLCFSSQMTQTIVVDKISTLAARVDPNQSSRSRDLALGVMAPPTMWIRMDLTMMSSSSNCRSSILPSRDRWSTDRFSHPNQTTVVARVNHVNLSSLSNRCETTQSDLTKDLEERDLLILRLSSPKASRLAQFQAIWASSATISSSTRVRCRWTRTMRVRTGCRVGCPTTQRLEWMTFWWSSRRWSMRHRVVRRASRQLDPLCSRRLRLPVLVASWCLQTSIQPLLLGICISTRATLQVVKGRSKWVEW